MSKWRRPLRAGVCACAGFVLLPATAAAFEVKHTSSGLPVHWAQPSVEFVIDSSITAAVSNGDQAAAAAAQAWSGASGTPVLSTSHGTGATKPKVDGINTVMFAPNGYGPAGGALAITVLSYDDKTGDIIDADIVINGAHAFAVLAAGTRAPDGAVPVSTESSGGSDDDDHESHGNGPTFDLQHVVTHELGHALGLGDVRTDSSAVMYAYTTPNDASSRAPSSDDLAGVDELYAGSSTSPAPTGGCGGASIAATRARSGNPWAGVALVLAVGAWLAARRRAGVNPESQEGAQVRVRPYRRSP